MNENIKHPRGSEWRKWDLHIHSPLSVLNNQYPRCSDGSPDWDKFISKLEEVEDISVIGITDYFSLDGYKKVSEFKEARRLKNFDLILPNIELRLDTFVVKNKSKEINFHIIFDGDELEVEDIENEFLKSLEIESSGSKDGLAGTRNLTKSAILAIGKQIKKFHPRFKDDPYEEAAFKNITVRLKQVQELLRKDLFKGKFLFVLSGGEWADIDWNQAYLTKKNFLQVAHILETGSSDTINWALGKKDLSKKDFKKEFGSLKPSIFGSDAHRLDKICKPHEDKFCWIKADPTFEGLKQIVYEPEERVRIQKSSPKSFKTTYSLSFVSISNSKINKELEIKEIELPITRDLVAVIGGKGTGKTALLDLIANCYVDRVNSNDRNSFARRISGDCIDLNTKLKFIESSDFSKSLIENKFVTHSKVEYIPQGQIENLISNHKDFHEYLQSLIFESGRIKDSTVLYEYERIKQSIRKNQDSIRQINREIFDLENKTRDEIVKGIIKKLSLRRSEKKDREKEIENFKKQLSPEKIEKAKEIQGELSKKITRRKKLINLQDLISEVSKKLTIIESLNKYLQNINSLLRELEVSGITLEIFSYRETKKQLEQIEQKVPDELLNVNKEIEKTRQKTESLEETIQKHSELLKQLSDIDKEIEELKDAFNQITKREKILIRKIDERLDFYKDLLSNYLNLKDKYEEIITVFSQEAEDILSGLEFKSSLEFEFQGFEESGEEVIDLRSLRTTKDEKASIIQSYQFKNFISLVKQLIKSTDNQSKELLTKLINELKNKQKSFLNILKPRQNNLRLYEWLYDDYCFLITSVYFNKIPSEKLSLGQKCTVLLKVCLAKGKNPILIDQPDDNLDNKFIMEELIKALRQANNNRQVIIATNNANVVMNSDAEQIIIAQFEKGKISYLSGSIENPIIRKNAIHILEGGLEAFINREKKYGIHE